jgi:hypothetical protein
MKQKTSIDQLIQDIKFELDHPDCFPVLKEGMKYCLSLIEHRKDMHRKEIEEAYEYGEINQDVNTGFTAKDYFNETFEE